MVDANGIVDAVSGVDAGYSALVGHYEDRSHAVHVEYEA